MKRRIFQEVAFGNIAAACPMEALADAGWGPEISAPPRKAASGAGDTDSRADSSSVLPIPAMSWATPLRTSTPILQLPGRPQHNLHRAGPQTSLISSHLRHASPTQLRPQTSPRPDRKAGKVTCARKALPVSFTEADGHGPNSYNGCVWGRACAVPMLFVGMSAHASVDPAWPADGPNSGRAQSLARVRLPDLGV